MTGASDEEIVHGTSVAIDGSAVLLTGPSGSGKSDLALRLIDRGAKLIGDDNVTLSLADDTILVNPLPETAGKLEIWSLGIFEQEYVSDVPLAIEARLGAMVERFPMDRQQKTILGRPVTSVALKAKESSAPIKVEMALKQALESGESK